MTYLVHPSHDGIHSRVSDESGLDVLHSEVMGHLLTLGGQEERRMKGNMDEGGS